MVPILPLLPEHPKGTGDSFKMAQTQEVEEKAAEENPERLTSPYEDLPLYSSDRTGKRIRQPIFRVTVMVGGTLMIPNFIAVMMFWETINSILKLATGRILPIFKMLLHQISM